MRPLKLSIKAFGPYADIQELNFKELGNRSIFLIHGPTGSGKTTILDAICFALYGDVSGSERNSKNMRSHHATIDQLTEVIFDFELRDEKYRVRRVPEQERLKKSGEGTTIQSPEAVLWKLLDSGEEVLIQTGWKNVTDEIEKRIGFKSSQFRQVIMLPQGEFRKLLLADSLERQRILERLFHTETYRKVEEMLKQSAKELKDTIKQLENQMNWSLNKAECESSEALKALIREREAQLEQMKHELDKKVERVKEIQQLFVKAKEGNEKLDEKEKVYEELKKWKEMIPKFNQKREALERARKAATLEETEKTTRLRKEDLERCEKELNEKHKLLTEAEKIYEAAEKQRNGENAREKDRELAAKRVNELVGYIDKVNQLEKVKKTVQKLKEEFEEAALEKRRMQEELKRLEEAVEQQDQTIENTKADVMKVPLYESVFREKEKIYNKKAQLDDLHKELRKVLTDYTNLMKVMKESEEEYIRSKQEYFALQEAWNRGQAAILAEKLKEGIPCPVCGSVHHPAVAQREAWIPAEEEVKEKREWAEKLEKYKEKIKDQFNGIKTKKEKLEMEIQTIEKELLENKDMTLQTLKRGMEDAKKQMETARQKAEKLEILQKKRNELKEEQIHCREALEKKENEFAQKSQAYQNAQGDLRAKEADIPVEIRSIDALMKAEEEAKQLLEQLKKAYEKAQRNFEEAYKGLIEAKTSHQEAKRALEEAKEKYLVEKNTFIQKLYAAGFEKYTDYENAKKDELSMNRIDKEIKDFEGKLRSAEDRYKRVSALTEGIEKVDLTKLQVQLAHAEKERDEAFKLENSLSERITTDKALLKEILKLDATIKEKEKEYEVVGYLSQVSNGDNIHGLTFQRFVLGVLLDDITIAATERLKLMSKGRYLLQRTLDRSRKNAAGGLELEVFDTYTGIERPVSTLSGGETFLASLSLALGLADVVQSYSGGISLDTIFIDEGFGTLDPEALDLAMKALIDLQEGGRLVGIISHVPELRERIDAQLEVTMSEKGSTARFKLTS